MKNYWLKTNTTNTVNDNETNTFVGFETTEERDEEVQKIKDKEHEWNFNTPGARSFRNSSFDYYETKDLAKMSMSELGFLSLADFMNVLTQFIKDEQ